MKKYSIPHVCGGVSDGDAIVRDGRQYSPRVWGCFPKQANQLARSPVFPTCVWVFPSGCARRNTGNGIPHVCGGVSDAQAVYRGREKYSPRVWGCFSLTRAQALRRLVFPTCVGVFLGAED